MNRYVTYLLLVLILVSCKDRLVAVDPLTGDAVELKGVEAYMDGNIPAKAPALDAYNYVGRSNFVNNDQMVLTTIKRTESTIPGFHYSGIVYDHVIEQGQTSGGWNRDASEGYAHASDGSLLTTHPERIYWSDSKNGHTYIGYSVPQQPVDGKDFDWTVMEATYGGAGTQGIPVYYGSLGDPTQLQSIVGEVVTNYIDYTNNLGETPVRDNLDDPNSALSYKTGNDKIKCDDILLTWDNEKVAETGGSVAKLYFHHGLAQVRVIVNIQGFSASTDAADSRSVVSDMILKNMLTMYRWKQQSYKAEALDATYDAANISAIYGAESGVTCDQKKDVHLWIPRPAGTGSGTGKQFTFYALAVPQVMGVDNATTSEQIAGNLNFEFKVKYPNPMNPDVDVTKTYRAHLPNSVEFRAGHCTTINITLNHNNEQMTVGAEYMDWQLVETPDQGELKKNLTFLEHTDRSKVTILGDTKATEDDATWLYVDKTTEKILDIYGNDGSQANPFKISTADQLLSFAYEVKGTSRTKAVTYLDISTTTPTTKTIPVNGGFDFTGYWVTLDADITMQESLEGTDVVWPGIGDATKDGAKYLHPFNGVFNGGYRHINRLKGSPLFTIIGEDGIVDHLFISDALGITGRGSIAEANYGVICGAYIEGDVEATNSGNSSGSYCGSIVGDNHSMLISCGHIGDVEGTNYESVGSLVGYNNGIVAICYNCGDVKSDGEKQYAGIGEYTPRSIAYCCYYNGDLYTGQDYEHLDQRIGHVAFPLTTAMMQSNVFVNKEATMVGDLSKADELFDDEIENKTDPFFFHLSLNYGIRRAVAMLKRAVQYREEDSDGYILIHEATTDPDDPNKYDDLKLKKTLVQWLIDHYSKEITPGGELQFSHQFQFSPGNYPKLQ